MQVNCGHPNAGAMLSLSMKIGSAVVGKQRDGHVESADVQIRESTWDLSDHGLDVQIRGKQRPGPDSILVMRTIK